MKLINLYNIKELLYQLSAKLANSLLIFVQVFLWIFQLKEKISKIHLSLILLDS